MTTICYFPIVNDEKELTDVLSRAAWFLSFCTLSRISIPISSERLRSLEWSISTEMDVAIDERLDRIRGKVVLVLATSEAELAPCMAEADIILKWRINDVPNFLSLQKLKAWEAGKKVWSVDPRNTRMEGSFYIEVGLHLLRDREALVQENKRKFDALSAKLGRFKHAYVIATGPSVWRYRLYDYKDAISLICNSVILDNELMARVRPQILVFADPIFHFGPSRYSATFRQRLREVARIYDFTIVIPFKYYGIFVSTMPELRDRTIAIPFAKDRPFNFDISADFEVRTTANILTLLLIPLAATFSNEIGILGCDGRPNHDHDYFWGHNQKTQINDKMANIREVHPAFFDINYNDYYLEHCQTLESALQDGERRGKQFLSLGFSHIPALKSRIEWGRRAVHCDAAPIRTALIVDPDAKSWAGHYMAYNEKLSAQLERDGFDVGIVCRTDLSADIIALRKNYLRVLTAHSWQVGNRAENGEFLKAFEEEITDALGRFFARCEGPVLLYMYCGSLEHAEILRRLVQVFPRLIVNINLFWLSFRLTPEYAQRWKPFIERLDEEASAGTFVASVPTTELRDRLAELTGCILPVAPHPSTGVSDSTFQKMLLKKPDTVCKRPLNVLFPSAPRPEKGYLTSVESVRQLCSESGEFRPIIRHAPTFSTPTGFAEPFSILRGAEVVEGELTDDEFLELFAKSDIVVLPYTREAFAERTSGLLIDSMYFGIPCVVMRGTWLGSLTEKFGCGVVVEELSAESLVAAVREIATNFDEYCFHARAAGENYFINNSWRAFSQFLRNPLESCSRSRDMERALLLGPNPRERRAHWDETSGIAELFSKDLSGSVMIDVGAHHGSALIPFLNKKWSVFAFEPDNRNRAKLLKRLSTHKNKHLVLLDTRCLSNRPQKAVCFYASEQSTGISGLSAFHETHRESQRVDITTLIEFFENRQMPAVDFLKIDTEGHDLFVLQGYPWEHDKPAVIECEFEDAKTVPLGYTFHDLARYLVDIGYTVYVSEWHPIIRYGIRHDWRALMRYPCQLADPRSWGNLLAFREPIDEQALVAAIKKVLNVSAGKMSKASSKPARLPLPASSAGHLQSSGKSAFRFEPSPHYTQTAPNQWRYTHAQSKQRLWVAALGQRVAAGQEFVGELRIQAERAMTVDVSLGRHGNTDYEGASQRIKLAQGVAQTVKLVMQFSHSHPALKLQAEVIELFSGESSHLTINGLFITESLASVERRVGRSNITLCEANRLFREGDLSTAIPMYLLLHEQRQLPMYQSNALLAARRMGMEQMSSVEELRRRMEPTQ